MSRMEEIAEIMGSRNSEGDWVKIVVYAMLAIMPRPEFDRIKELILGKNND